MVEDYVSINAVLCTIEGFFCSTCPDYMRCDRKCEIAKLMDEIEKLPTIVDVRGDGDT